MSEQMSENDYALTPPARIAAQAITACAACLGKHWCPNCEDRREALAGAIEALIETEGGSR